MRRLPRPALAVLIMSAGLVVGALTTATMVAGAPVAAAMQIVGDDPQEDLRAAEDTSRAAEYGLWTLVAVCLILAGLLLVRIERWEARRIPDQASSGRGPQGRAGESVPR